MLEVLEEAATSHTEQKTNSEVQKTDSKPSSESINSIHFKLPVFEGPLDLLLHLIKENKIDIYDIPIIEITQQYMSYIELMKDLNLEIAGDYLVMAATLIHIKSKTLLPPAEKEQEEPLEDPRSELVQRLLEYQSYKESSQHLRKREDVWKNVYTRNLPDPDSLDFGDEPELVEANVFDLISAFQKMLSKAPEQVLEISRETLTVADRINFIVDHMEEGDALRFEDLFEEGCKKVLLIVTFLALLETIRLGLVKLYQEKSFGQIWLLNPQKENALPESAVTTSVEEQELSETVPQS